jgi:hypothetical protein
MISTPSLCQQLADSTPTSNNGKYGKDIQLLISAGFGASGDYGTYVRKYYPDGSILTGNLSLGCELRAIDNLFVIPKIGVRFSEISIAGSSGSNSIDGNTIYHFGFDARYYYEFPRKFLFPNMETGAIAVFANVGVSLWGSMSGNPLFKFESHGPITEFTVGSMWVMSAINIGSEIGWRSIPVKPTFDVGGFMINCLIQIPLKDYE